ncbi:polysaccharide deacetylase family protein [Streptomyces sp. TP-A0356]|uniref:polysaccharide deacetylase family protein n=1 Tax=Streptomyces sp. TP-A0356 TaxID=1359208 RepID=UPI0007C702CC|nr:polysaccharide deacetylase family protein [Streptomyces sp. TP-A0356]
MSLPHAHSPARRAAVALVPFAAVAAAHMGPAATWLPGLRRRFFPGLAGVGRRDHIALTFDDGPDPRSTPRFLDALDGLGVRATFFVLGESVERHPALARETAERGHELAVHGWTHSRPWLPLPGRDVADLVRAVDAVYDAAGRRPRWYRPPYGILTSGRWAAARRAGLRPVLWTAWGRDWTADAAPASVHAALASGLRGGGTLLLHDSDRASAAGCWHSALGALPGIVNCCRAAGLSVGPLAEHGTGAAAAPCTRAPDQEPLACGGARPRRA